MNRDINSRGTFTEQLLEQSAVATFVLNPRHQVILWNKACEALTGLPASQLLGTDHHWKPFYGHKRETLADIVIDGNIEALPLLYQEHAPSSLIAEGLHAEGWYPNLNGRSRYIIFEAAPVRDDHGALVAVIETLQDLPERRRLEENLILLKEAIESLPIGITITDSDGRMLYLNPAEAEMHGCEVSDLAGKDSRVMAPQTIWQAIPFEQLHAMGSWRRESVNVRRNGELFPVQLTSRAVKNADGAPIGVVTACEDVTDRKKSEEKLRKAQTLEAIGKLAAGVAHEVRNPLNAIMAISEALAGELGDNAEYKPFLTHIREQVDRLSVLMRDLLDLGKPVDQLSLRSADLRELCSAAIDIWKHSGVQRTHAVRMTAPDGPARVKADERRLQQVILNLLDNASQHSPEGSEIRLSVLEPQDGFCRLSVSDRGTGMTPEIQARIFEPFYSTRRGGIGLGMSIVKHIVENHGGSVSVANNDPPPGGAVVVSLPQAQEELS
jgi:PAS domain S-box-containing protein